MYEISRSRHGAAQDRSHADAPRRCKAREAEAAEREGSARRSPPSSGARTWRCSAPTAPRGVRHGARPQHRAPAGAHQERAGAHRGGRQARRRSSPTRWSSTRPARARREEGGQAARSPAPALRRLRARDRARRPRSPRASPATRRRSSRSSASSTPTSSAGSTLKTNPGLLKGDATAPDAPERLPMNPRAARRSAATRRSSAARASRSCACAGRHLAHRGLRPEVLELPRRISFTCAGLALPWVAFITWPTSALKAFSLPAR